MNSVTHQREDTSPAPPRRKAWGSWLDPGEPHPFRGPFTRWPRVADSALAVVRVGDSGGLTLLQKLPCPGGPAHVSTSSRGDRVVTASYGSGEVRVFARTAARLEGLPVPFELDLGVVGERLQGRFRNTRLVGARLPDLRAAMAWEVRPRLRGDTIEVDLEAAWLELPDLVPLPINRWARQVESMVGLLPIRVTVPARAELPRSEHGEDDVSVRVESLELRDEQIDLVVALDLEEHDDAER